MNRRAVLLCLLASALSAVPVFAREGEPVGLGVAGFAVDPALAEAEPGLGALVRELARSAVAGELTLLEDWLMPVLLEQEGLAPATLYGDEGVARAVVDYWPLERLLAGRLDAGGEGWELSVRLFTAEAGGLAGEARAEVTGVEGLPRALHGLLRELGLPVGGWKEPVPVPAGRYGFRARYGLGRLLAGEGWEKAEPFEDPGGLLRVKHARTGLEFLLVPAGTFVMGTDGSDFSLFGSNAGMRHTAPRREVSVPAFLLCRTECSLAAWDRIGGEDEREWDEPEVPVHGVSFPAVDEWCRKAGLRLPSEAEWEYACLVGAKTVFPWGDAVDPIKEYAWIFPNSGAIQLPLDNAWSDKIRGEWKCRPHPVGTLKPNRWGFHNMVGNVTELCADLFYIGYEGYPVDGSPMREGESGERVQRGGCWVTSPLFCSPRYRARVDRNWHPDSMGFRPAKSLF